MKMDMMRARMTTPVLVTMVAESRFAPENGDFVVFLLTHAPDS